MILSKYINVKISNNQIKYYKELGYNVKGGNEIISVDVLDLPNNSGVKMILVILNIFGIKKASIEAFLK